MKFQEKPESRIRSQVEKFALANTRKRPEWALFLQESDKPGSSNIEALRRKYGEEYLAFLRDRKNDDVINTHEEVLNMESTFRSELLKLKAEVAEYESPSMHPDYLGEGDNGIAFIRTFGGQRVVFKFYKKEGKSFNGNARAYFSHEIHALELMNGVKNVPQIIAIAPDELGYAMTILEGKSLTSFKENPVNEFTDEHIAQVIEIFIKLNSKKIAIDILNPSNLLFGKDGLSVIDFIYNGRNGRLIDVMAQLEFILANAVLPKVRDVVTLQKWMEDSLRFRIKFLRVLKETFPEIYAERTLGDGSEFDPRVYRMSFELDPALKGVDLVTEFAEFYRLYEELKEILKT